MRNRLKHSIERIEKQLNMYNSMRMSIKYHEVELEKINSELLIQEKSFSVLKKAQEGVTDIHSRLEAMQSYALSYILEQNVKFS